MGRFPVPKNSGRGRGKPSQRNKNSGDSSGKEYKFYPLGMGKNNATFDMVKDKVENDIQQTFGKGSKAVVHALRDMEEHDWNKDYPKEKWFINQAVNTQRKYNQYQAQKEEESKNQQRWEHTV